MSLGKGVCVGLLILCIQWIVLCLALRFSHSPPTEVPDPPYNVSIVCVYGDGVEVAWSPPDNSYLVLTELYFHQLGHTDARVAPWRYTVQVEKSLTSYSMRGLLKDTEYELYIKSCGRYGIYSNASETITFKTTRGSGSGGPHLAVHPFEMCVVAAVLGAWILAIFSFLRYWGTVSISAPVTSKQRKQPQNLDTIKVVKHPTDSVIYRGHSERYSKTMAAREKRLARLNTMPVLRKGQVAPPVLPHKSCSLGNISDLPTARTMAALAKERRKHRLRSMDANMEANMHGSESDPLLNIIFE